MLGTPKLGQTLTAEAGGYPPGDAEAAIQWLRDGEPVLNATGPSYQLTNLDLGAHLRPRHAEPRRLHDHLGRLPRHDRVKTDPVLRVQVDRLKRRIAVLVTVTAPGVDAVSGTVVARIAGVRQEVELRANGTARVVFRDLKPGERTLTVLYAGSDAVSQASYSPAACGSGRTGHSVSSPCGSYAQASSALTACRGRPAGRCAAGGRAPSRRSRAPR